jgi:hypothetical protein
MGHGLGCDVAGGARPNLDEELLAELFRQELRDQARDDIGCAARRLADDDFHRTRWIGLRAGASREQRGTRRQLQKIAYGRASWADPLLTASEREQRCERTAESTVRVSGLPRLAALTQGYITRAG